MPLYDVRLKEGLGQLRGMNEGEVIRLAAEEGTEFPNDCKTYKIEEGENMVKIRVDGNVVSVIEVKGNAFDLHGSGERLGADKIYPIGGANKEVVRGSLFYVGSRNGPCWLVVNVSR
jgi:hypothetical protein